MCNNTECPMRKSCYRYLAVPFSPVQTYADFKPDEKGECPDYWMVQTGMIIDKKKINQP